MRSRKLQASCRPRAHVRAVRPRAATAPPARSGEIDAKHAHLLSVFAAATQSGDLNTLTQLLASGVRILTDGGGKVRAAQEVIDGAIARRGSWLRSRANAGQWWREDFTVRFAIINGRPGVIVDAPEGPVQTAAFEIDGNVIRGLYVVRNPDKLRHLAAAATPHERGPGLASGRRPHYHEQLEHATIAVSGSWRTSLCRFRLFDLYRFAGLQFVSTPSRDLIARLQIAEHFQEWT